MRVWVVAIRGKGLAVGDYARITYPSKYDRNVIYYQGRPVPTLGKKGNRHFGLLTRAEDFNAIGLVACELQVLGKVHDVFGGGVLRAHGRPP